MVSQDQVLHTVVSSNAFDGPLEWFWQFLKTELAPYPGRAGVVGRITVAATITMILVMTFRVPYGFLGAIFTILLSRENPTATLLTGLRTVLFCAIGTAYTFLGIILLADDPLTHFLWIAISLFLAFYAIRILPDYFTAVAFGLTLSVAIPVWDNALLTVDQRIETTLWLGYSVLIGSAVTIAVEYAFRSLHPATYLTQAIEGRLSAVENVLRQIAADRPLDNKVVKEISQYSALGTSRARRLLLHSGEPAQFIAQMNAATALLGRLVDLAASMRIVRSDRPIALPVAERERCLRLANQISELRQDLRRRQLPRAIDISGKVEASDLPLLPEMERTVALIPLAFSRAGGIEGLFHSPPLRPEAKKSFLVPDAFTNPDHLKFAIRGGAATLLAYIIYQAVDWTGLNGAVFTCIITALSTMGSSRQKQFLRLIGAILGGIVFGIGAQVFILPYLDSIAGFTMLFALVTLVSAWIVTATPRLSYLGVVVALTFYQVNLQEFAIQSSLAVARDRVVGVFLGLVCMWLVFDRLWVREASQEMQDAFARNLQLLAELVEQSSKKDRNDAAGHILQLRDQINEGFNTVRSQADAVLFEFGPSREQKLKIRDHIRRWQPSLGALLQVQITFFQYHFERRIPELPQPVAEAETAFERDMTAIVRAMSAEVESKNSIEEPDIRKSADKLRQEIENQYGAPGRAIPPPLEDVITLTHNLVSIVAPLYADIRATFASPQMAEIYHPQIELEEA